MSDRDSTSGGRRRPTYGLPGPVPGRDDAAPQGQPGAQGPGVPGHDGQGYGAQGYGWQGYDGQGYDGQEQYGAPSPVSAPVRPAGQAAPQPSQDPYGASPHGHPAGASPYAASAPAPGGPTQPRKRRGIIPLVVGLVLLLVIAPAVTIGGLVWSFGSIVSDQVSGPTVLQGSSGEVPMAANEMIIVYIPSEDAAGSSCTAETPDQGSITIVPTSGTVTFGDGSTYEQAIGVAAVADTTVTVSCEGTDAPAYLGPYSVFGIAGPLLIGPAIGIFTGLAGLVLVIVGIVKLVRSRRS